MRQREEKGHMRMYLCKLIRHHLIKMERCWGYTNWVRNPPLPVSNCETLHKYVNSLNTCFLFFWNGDRDISFTESFCFIFFPLEYNCFTKLCSFLLCNSVNQLYVCVCVCVCVFIYIYTRIASPLLGSPSCLPPPRPTYLGHHGAFRWAPCATQKLPSSYLCYT